MPSMISVASAGIDGLSVATHAPIGDDRGELERLFCASDMADAIGDRTITQVNRTRTQAVGAVRGMHFQLPPHAEMKLVACTRGRVFDVAVDLRSGSETFLQYDAVELAPENHRTFIIPEGFAHGFQVLEPDSELLYLHTAIYTPNAERAVSATDPAIGIEWPLPITQMSERDRSHDPLDERFRGVVL